MIWQVVRKELLVNLLSLRFAVGLVVVVLMMGLVGYVLIEDYAFRQQSYISDVQRHNEELIQTKVYSKLNVAVDIPPSALSIFSRGARDLPSQVQVSPYHVPSLIDEGGTSTNINLGSTSNRRFNPLLKMFASMDLSVVISIILSLFAILLVFDSFSGEREQGTLKLLLSSSTGRVQLLLGKFFGALLTLAVPLTLGFLVVMLLWSFSPRISLAASDWVGVTLMYLFSLVFLSSFLAGGLLVSLFAEESSSGLMYILLAWVLVAIVIPEGAGYLAEYFGPEEIRENVVKEAEQGRREFQKAYSSIVYHQKTEWNNANLDRFGGEAILGITEEDVHSRSEFNKKAFPLKFQFAEERHRVVESYATALDRWSRMRDNLVRPSICVLYRNIVQAIAGTDIDSYRTLVRHVQIYREALMAYLQPKVGTPEWFTRALEYPEVQPTEKNRRGWQELIESRGERAVEKIMSWDRIAPLDLSTMPPPHISFPGLAERMKAVLADELLLAASTVLFLALSIWRVLRYAVR